MPLYRFRVATPRDERTFTAYVDSNEVAQALVEYFTALEYDVSCTSIEMYGMDDVEELIDTIEDFLEGED